LTELLASDAAGIARAAELLRAGQLVAFGTETVFGLGADATDARAVAAVFDAKGRPHFNPLICHYPDADAAFADVEAPELALRLAAAFWPGPLTLVLPRRITCRVALLAGAGLETLAVRVPAHATALALLRAVGRPVAAPSANRSGQVSPTTAAHVLEALGGRIAAILDSGPCPIGVESTVLDLTGRRPFLLRPGGHHPRGDRGGRRPGAAWRHARDRAGRHHAALAGIAGVALRADPARPPCRHRGRRRRGATGVRAATRRRRR
jgi:L-threonylcarbamoyladenylate synthase